VIKQYEADLPIAESTIYTWKKKASGLESAYVRKLKRLSDENEYLKCIVTDPGLDKILLQDLNTEIGKRATAA